MVLADSSRNPKDKRLRRRGRLRDAKRACLDEAGEMNAKRSRAIAEKNAGARVECELRMNAAWSLYRKLEAVEKWVWNEETMLAACEHRDSAKTADDRDGRAYCGNCGMVFKAEAV